MRVLVLGSGGREHAIVRSIARDTADIHVAPGNAGSRTLAQAHDINISDPAAVVDLARNIAADLVVIGPELPLVCGVADALREAGIAVFGPGREAAQIESSKSFAKAVMTASGVPTGRAFTCHSMAQVQQAMAELHRPTSPYVVKDDGLAAGKGVVVTLDEGVATAHASECLAAGSAVLVEEFLSGPEVSLFVVTDGATALPLIPAQDFKRVRDNDEGPNTGGMGAYAPLPWLPQRVIDAAMSEIVQPVIDELARRGTPFVGLLYAGLIITTEGLKVIEFNARFGDPETQAVLALLTSSLTSLLLAAATGELHKHPALQWASGAAVTVVVAAPGYPEEPQLGGEISIPDDSDQAYLLHAGTFRDGELRASGGRVLCATAVGETIEEARTRAYDVVANIAYEGAHHRTDIGLRASRGDIASPI